MSNSPKEPEELTKITKDKKPSTVKAYRISYNKLLDLVKLPFIYDEEDNEPVDDVETLISRVMDDKYTKLNTKQLSLNILLLIFRVYGLDGQEKIIAQRDENKKKLDLDRIQKNKIVKNELPTYEELQKLLNKLYTDDEYLRYIVNYLMIMLSIRNKDIGCVRVVDSKKKMTNQDDNYLVITQKYVLFVRFNYKTSGTYGMKENRITSKKFTSALLNYMNENNLDLDGDGFYLLRKKNGERLPCEKVGDMLKYLTLDDLNETLIAKIKITDIADKPNAFQKIKKLSNNRGTKVDTIISHYDLNF
jgi:hypothetical protein